MKVLLVNSTWNKFSSQSYNINVYTPEVSTVWPPLGLGYIASYLEKSGHTVVIVDRNCDVVKCNYELNLLDENIIEILNNFEPDLVGISATTPTINDAFHIAKLIKSKKSKLTIILGGIHGSSLPEETLRKCNSIDAVVIGEGETALSEICSAKPFNEIPGIAYRQHDTIIKTEKRVPIDNIDNLPYPARHLFDMEFYLRPSTQVIFGYKCRATPIVSSRGCPNSCRFCSGPIISQNKVRYHSPDYTINELEILVNEYHVEGVFFSDEMFTGNRKRVVDLCNLMIERGLSNKLVWGVQLRVDYVDYDLLKLMKSAGCVQVEYGFESGSQRILNEMGKNITPHQCRVAAEITHKAGLRMLANIIVGWPSERLEDLLKTIDLVKETKPDFVSWHEFKPLPGSYSWKYAKLHNIEDESFEKNEPFLFCTVSEKERTEMLSLYKEQLKRNLEATNTAQGLYSDKQ